MQSGQLRRRKFIMLLGGAAAALPLAVRAQQSVPVIGFVSNVPRENYARLMPAFSQGLSETGFAEDRM